MSEKEKNTFFLMKIDWVRKLTSRKFWTAVTSFVSMLIIFQGGTTEKAERITALIIAGASVVAYIIGEGLTDMVSAKTVLVPESALEEEGEEDDEGLD